MERYVSEKSLSIQGNGNNDYDDSNVLNSLPFDEHSSKELSHLRGVNLIRLGRLE